jgi:hypothetical protein
LVSVVLFKKQQQIGPPELIDRSPPWLHIIKVGEEHKSTEGDGLKGLFLKWAKGQQISTTTPKTTTTETTAETTTGTNTTTQPEVD